MFNFEVLNLEMDCKEAEQKLLKLSFKLDCPRPTNFNSAFTFVLEISVHF